MLTCLGNWTDGTTHFFTGEISSSNQLVRDDADRYRCFIYESAPATSSYDYMMAQSGEASCSGLTSINAGYRVLRLSKGKKDAVLILKLFL